MGEKNYFWVDIINFSFQQEFCSKMNILGPRETINQNC